MTLDDFKRDNPSYKDWSDKELAEGLHDKFYKDMPFEKFAGQVGYKAEDDNETKVAKFIGRNVPEGPISDTLDALNSSANNFRHPIETVKNVSSGVLGSARAVPGMVLSGAGTLGGLLSGQSVAEANQTGSENADKATTLGGLVPQSDREKQVMDLAGKGFGKVGEVAGNIAANTSGFTDQDVKDLQSRFDSGDKNVTKEYLDFAMKANAAMRSSSEGAAQLVTPIPGLKGATRLIDRFTKSAEKPIDPNSVRAKLDAINAEKQAKDMGPPAPGTEAYYKYLADQKTLEAQQTPIALPNANPEPTPAVTGNPPMLGPEDTLRQVDTVPPNPRPELPEAPEAIQGRVEDQLSQMNGLPPRSPEALVRPPETPLPTISDPDAVPYKGPELLENSHEASTPDTRSINTQPDMIAPPRMPIETLQHNMVKEKMQRMVDERDAAQAELGRLQKIGADKNAYDYAASQGTVPSRESLPLRVAELKAKIAEQTKAMTDYTTEKGIPDKNAALGARDIYETKQPTVGDNKVEKTQTYVRPGMMAPGARLRDKQGGAVRSDFLGTDKGYGILKKLMDSFRKNEKAPAVDIHQNEGAAKAIQDIPGLKDSPWTPTPTSLADRKNYVLQGRPLKDSMLNGARNLLASGTKGMVALTHNRLLKIVGQDLDGVTARANHLQRTMIADVVKPAFDKLSFKDTQGVWQAMTHAFEAGTDYHPSDLTRAGLNPKQIEAYQALRGALDKTLDHMNDTLKAEGKKPISRETAYLAFRTAGDYKVYIHDTDGHLVYFTAEKNRWSANRALNYLKDNYKADKSLDWQGSKVIKQTRETRTPSDFVELGYMRMLEMLDHDDPRVQSLKGIKDDYDAQKTFDAFGFKNHLKTKTGKMVGEGFKPWRSEGANARQGLNSQLKVMEEAIRWSEQQRSFTQTAKLLNDPDVMRADPHGVTIAKEKLRNSMGYGESEMGKGIDGVISAITHSIGFDPNLFTSIRDGTKAVLYTKFFALNPLFWSVQGLQALQGIPQLMKNGAAKHWLPALADTTAFITKKMAGKLSGEQKSILEYGQKNDIWKDAFMSDIRDLTKGRVMKGLDTVSSIGAKQIEQATRFGTFMNLYHMFKRSGMDHETAMQTAGNLTNHTMVDYRPHESPQIYQNLGMLGKSASTLRRFTHNQYTQLAEMAQHFGTTGNPMPLIAMLSTQMILGGALGFFGVNEIDSIYKILKNHGVVHGDGPKAFMIKNFNDLVNFGGVSKLTGIDMSSRMAAGGAVPDGLVSTVAPLLSDAVKDIGSVAHFAGNPNKVTGMEMAHQLAPSSMQGIVEKGMTAPDGRVMDPNDATKGELLKRTPTEQNIRFLGGRSLRESKLLQSASENKMDQASILKNRESAVKGIEESFLAKDVGQTQAHIKDYLKYGGDPRMIPRMLVTLEKNEHMDRLQREVGRPSAGSIPSLERARAAIEYQRALDRGER